jgi:uncharacterized lipoprotein NlpE involved in copper resistance
MKRVLYLLTIFAVLMSGLEACKSKTETKESNAPATDVHHSRNSTDWAGIYTGTIPCADCPGINVKITLNPDETYTISYRYEDKQPTDEFVQGKFTWSADGGTIKLDCQEFPPFYRLGEKKLIQLDMEGNPITGALSNNYILTQEHTAQ